VLIASALIASLVQPHIIATLEGPEFVRMGIVAEIIERPPGVSNEQFAEQLIQAEGLKPWSGEQIDIPAVDGHMATKAVVSGDGREVIVKYLPGEPRQPGKVCRLRLARGGMSEARWYAYKWCAEAFGLTLPERVPPPIRVE